MGTLVLCLVAFVLTAGEAWAAEQPSKTTQPGTVESTTTVNEKVAEPVPGAKPPPVVTPPVEKPAVEDPAPPPSSNETPPAKDPSPLPPSNETPPAEDPSPPPSDPAPSTPEKPEVAAPQPTPRPATQWFTATTDEEVVESAPVLTTSQSVTDFGQVLAPKPMPKASPDATPGVTDPAPAPAAPAAADDGYAFKPSPDPVLPAPGPAAASEQVLPAASGLAGLVQRLVAEPAVPTATPQGAVGGPLPTPTNTVPVAGLTPSALVPAVPASLGEALRLPSSLGTTAASAVGTVQSTAASVASATAEVLEYLAGGSSIGTSSTNYSTDGTQEQPSEGTPPQQPSPAPLAPLEGVSFSPSMGGGQLGSGSGFAPLLVGILALLTTIMLGRDLRTYLVSCEMSKPSSALLLPLERPG